MELDSAAVLPVVSVAVGSVVSVASAVVLLAVSVLVVGVCVVASVIEPEVGPLAVVPLLLESAEVPESSASPGLKHAVVHRRASRPRCRIAG